MTAAVTDDLYGRTLCHNIFNSIMRDLISQQSADPLHSNLEWSAPTSQTYFCESLTTPSIEVN